MSLTRTLTLAAVLGLSCGPFAVAKPARPVHPTPAEWIAAAKAAPLGRFSEYGGPCGSNCTVDAWLRGLTRGHARGVRWSAGRCVLVIPERPSDAGGRYCAQARIDVARPQDGAERPMIEVFLEDPQGGRPGRAYAFRGAMQGVGSELTRFPEEFEGAWTAAYPPDANRAQ